MATGTGRSSWLLEKFGTEGSMFELHSIADEGPSRRCCTNGVNQMHYMKLLYARQRQSGWLALAMHKPPPHQYYNCREDLGKGDGMFSLLLKVTPLRVHLDGWHGS